MSKTRTVYSCQQCGYSSAKWLGRCPTCASWNTFVEEKPVESEAQPGTLAALRDELKSTPQTVEKAHYIHLGSSGKDTLEETESRSDARRLSTSIGELDRVLGGGLVPDSFVLLGGDPGIGKSTLLLQMARGLLEKQPEMKLLYVSGEESVQQIRSRARRLGIGSEPRLFVAAETQLERAFGLVKEIQPDVLVMDSLQTFSTGFVDSSPGSVSQVREVAARLMTLAKSAGVAVWLVGHVTKEGSIAGPKVVEHMVDTVLYFEGEGGFSYRLLRTIKNRFGGTHELGVFEMEGEGLKEVPNPSTLFLGDRKESVAGTAVTCMLEGSRPLLIELQALVAPSPMAMPRRTAVGFDSARLSLLAAVIERHLGLPLSQRDLFFNVAGGLRISEPACDLAAAASIWSSSKDQAFPTDWIFIGEVALTGEVRRVPQLEARLNEAAKLGFKTAVISRMNSSRKESGNSRPLTCLEISRVSDLAKLAAEAG